VWCFASNFGHPDPFIGASVYTAASAAGTIASSASDWIFYHIFTLKLYLHST